jgi:hypothetical protein
VRNEFDIFISLSIKNWAANQHPPKQGREYLLHQAGVSSMLKQNIQDSNIFKSPQHPPGTHQTALPYVWTKGPLILSQLWTLIPEAKIHIFI